jgi:hypothetical protein
MSKQTLVFKHLLDGKSITSWEAIEKYGATRLSAIIFNLKKNGIDVQDEWVEEYDRYGNRTRFKRYFLANKNERMFYNKADAERFVNKQKGKWYMKFKNLHWFAIKKD